MTEDEFIFMFGITALTASFVLLSSYGAVGVLTGAFVIFGALYSCIC